MLALAVVVFAAETKQDQETAEQYYHLHGAYPSWYPYGAVRAFGYPYGAGRAFGYPYGYGYNYGAFPNGVRSLYGAYPNYGYGYSYGYWNSWTESLTFILTPAAPSIWNSSTDMLFLLGIFHWFSYVQNWYITNNYRK